MSIKEIRKELGVTQTEFARLFGVHQTAVSQWETGRTSPDIDMVIQIARGTGHSVDEVLGVHTQSPIPMGASTTEIQMPDDSMAGARIRKGDNVFIRLAKDEIRDGSLVGVKRNGKDTIRFIRFIEGDSYLLDARIPAQIEKAGEEDMIFGTVMGMYVNFVSAD